MEKFSLWWATLNSLQQVYFCISLAATVFLILQINFVALWNQHFSSFKRHFSRRVNAVKKIYRLREKIISLPIGIDVIIFSHNKIHFVYQICMRNQPSKKEFPKTVHLFDKVAFSADWSA